MRIPYLPRHARRTVARAWAQEREAAAAFLPAGVICGALGYFAWPGEPAWWIAAGLVLAGMAGLLAARAWPGFWFFGALVLAAGLGFGAADWRAVAALPWDDPPAGGVVASGIVQDVDVLATGRRVTLTHVTLDPGGAIGRLVRLRLRDIDPAPVAVGDSIAVRALLTLPGPPAVPGGRDAARAAWFSGLGFYGFAIGPVQVISPGRPPAMAALRAAIAQRIRAVLPGDEGAIATTLLCGMADAVPQSLRAEFAASGLAHILAVAGLHLGSVMGVVFYLVRLGLALPERVALICPTKRIAALASLLAGGFYMALTGAHVPVERSFVMAALAVLAVFAGRRALSLRALGIAAIGLTLADPASVLGVSFQMSFAAVLALIVGYERIWPWMTQYLPADLTSRAVRLLRGVLALVLTSLLAGGATLPFAAYYFGTAGLLFVPANIVAVPLTAFVVLPAGLCAVLLMPLHGEFLALHPMGWGIDGLIGAAHVVAGLPGAAMAVGMLPPAVPLLFAAGLFLLCIGRTWLWRAPGLAMIAAAFLVALLRPLPDVLVSPGARAIGVVIGGKMLLAQSHHTDRFARDAILAAFGVRAGAQVAPACAAPMCRLALAGGTIVVMRDADARPACAGVAVIVAVVRVGRVCPGVAVLDATTTADGAAAVYLRLGGARIIDDTDARANRLWAPAVANLPFAPTE